MRGVTLRRVVIAGLAFAGAGPACNGGGGDGSGGGAPVVTVSSPDDRCVPLPGPFPPGLATVPGSSSRAVLVNFSPPAAIPFDLDAVPPRVAATGPVPTIPSDSDGDGRPDLFGPSLDGVDVASGVAWITASLLEEVLFADPASGALTRLRVELPASFAAGDFPLFGLAPGTAALRTAVSSTYCARPDPAGTDSRGVPLSTVLAAGGVCDPGEFPTRFTSGSALAAGRLFVSASNVGDDAGTANTQFLPGTVLAYDVDRTTVPATVRPVEPSPVIFTTAFNPTQVTAYTSPSGRAYVLVTGTGALGITQDDPNTPVIDSGGFPLTPSAIDVIEAVSARLVATVPLGAAALSFDRLAIDRTGRVAFTGSAAGRNVYAIDLAPLDTLPALAAGAPPYVLDGSDARVVNVDARIFDAAHPFRLPARPGGAPAQSCPGFVVGTAFNAFGSKLFATDFCDGTLTSVGVDLGGAPPVPVPRDPLRFSVLSSAPVADPIGAGGFGGARGLGSILVRPGRPGIDYRGPDVFVTVGSPEGLLCALRVDSF